MNKEKLLEYYISKEKKSLISGPFGSDISAKYFVDKGVPVIRGNNLSTGFKKFIDDGFAYITVEKADELNAYAVYDDLVFTAVGTLGQVGIIPQQSKYKIYTISNKQIRVRLDTSKLNPLFAFYWFTSPWMVDAIKSRNVGSTVPLINLFIVKNLPVYAPDEIENQKSIAKVLSDLDAKIELNNRINRELEAMAKTLYDYWFVQFDFPNEQGKPYKFSGDKMVYNTELKRNIPEGWVNGTLGAIAELVRGVTYDASEIKEENDSDVIPILRATNISGNVIDLDNMVFVPKQNVSSNQILNKFDILITMSSGSKDHIGKNGFFYFDKEVAFGAFCAKIVAKNKYRFYLYSYTQSDFMFSTIKNECLGTNINNLNGSLVKGFKLVVPPEQIIKSFNEKVSSVYEKIGNNLIQNQQLSELRDWLLPMLMNGQVTVKEAEEKLSIAAEPSTEYKKS